MAFSIDSFINGLPAGGGSSTGGYSPYGYTEDEKRKQRIAATAPIAGAFRAGAEDMRNSAARTGNDAALLPSIDRLSQARGLAISPALSGLEGRFGDARRADQKVGEDRSHDLLMQERDIAGRKELINAEKPTIGDRLWGAAGGALGAVAPELAKIGLSKIGLGGAAAAGTAAPAAAGTAGTAAGGAAGSAASTGGGLMGTIGGFLTNPFTIGAGALLAGGLVWKSTQAHPVADKWVQSQQNPFDQKMAAIQEAAKGGQLAPQDARTALMQSAQNYLTSLQDFAGQGGKQAQVARQALSTFVQYYGNPENYGIRVAIPA